jgi:hypothetical protein
MSGYARLYASQTAQNDFDAKVIFENEHTFCSQIHQVGICTAFEQMARAAAQKCG